MGIFFLYVLILIVAVSQCQTLPDQAKVKGRFTPVGSSNGQYNRTRRNAQKSSTSTLYELDLGPDKTNIYIELDSQSVWKKESSMYVQDGDSMKKVEVRLNADCIMSGHVMSEDGLASINMCGDMNGIIQTASGTYEIKGISKVDGTTADQGTVTIAPVPEDEGEEGDRKAAVGGDEEADALEVEEGDDDEEEDDDENEDRKRKRRATPTRVLEVGIYLDKSYVQALSVLGHTTREQIQEFMIRKWTSIKDVLDASEITGVDLQVSIKHFVIWNEEPAYYSKMAAEKRLGKRLRGFCRGAHLAKDPNVDLRVLYTKARSGSFQGMAYMKGICRKFGKCIAVKTSTPSVAIELHEIGHAFGLKHHMQITGCALPVGFMGYMYRTEFKPCYRRVYQNTVWNKSGRCLNYINV